MKTGSSLTTATGNGSCDGVHVMVQAVGPGAREPAGTQLTKSLPELAGASLCRGLGAYSANTAQRQLRGSASAESLWPVSAMPPVASCRFRP